MKDYEIGMWAEIPSPYVTSIIHKAGADFSIIDMEHGVIDFETAQNMIFAAKSEGKSTFIRVPAIEESWILRCLDMGGEGLIFPQVSCKEDAEKAVRLSRFRPQGDRGYNPYTTFGGYGNVPKDFLQKENDRIRLGVILESQESFGNIDDILAVDGIDIFYMGQYDLSVSLGIPGETLNPLVLNLMENALKKIRSAGKKAGCMIHSVEEGKEIIKQGFQFVVYKVDTGVFFDAVKSTIDGINSDF